MFDRLFDRRIHFFLLILFSSGVVGVTFGFYALWPANIERGYEPVQPIAFNHALHAGKGILPDGKLGLAIDCRYCHSDVETRPAATVPPLSTCMNCHSQVQPKVLPIPGDQRLQAYSAEQLAWWRQTGPGSPSQKFAMGSGLPLRYPAVKPMRVSRRDIRHWRQRMPGETLSRTSRCCNWISPSSSGTGSTRSPSAG